MMESSKKQKRPDLQIYRPPRRPQANESYQGDHVEQPLADDTGEMVFYNSKHKRRGKMKGGQTREQNAKERNTRSDNATFEDYGDQRKSEKHVREANYAPNVQSRKGSHRNQGGRVPPSDAYQGSTKRQYDPNRQRGEGRTFNEGSARERSRYYGQRYEEAYTSAPKDAYSPDKHGRAEHDRNTSQNAKRLIFDEKSQQPSDHYRRKDTRHYSGDADLHVAKPSFKNNEPTKAESKDHTSVAHPRSQEHSRRTNSGSKDFSDSRLFNPYEDDKKARERRALHQNAIHSSTHNPEDMHSNRHGGLIHLPNPVSFMPSNVGAGFSSHKQYGHGQRTDSFTRNPEKPIVVVRPQDRNFPPQPAYNADQVKAMYFPYYEEDFYQCREPPSNPALFNLVNEVKVLESHLAGALTNVASEDFPAWMDCVESLRQDMLIKYELILLTDLDYCNKGNIEQSMWKSAFYNVIELFRKCLDQPTASGVCTGRESEEDHLSSEILNAALELLEEGSQFLESCIDKLQNTYKVDINAVLNCECPPSETGSRTKKLVYLSVQKLMLFLGDLARYVQLLNNSNDFGKARSWYLKARTLAPKNGRPYNQLAVLAIYTNRRLDAMYYYMRTLAASNPFLTATQNLTSLFEEVRRKAEESLRQKQESLKRRRQRQSHFRSRSPGGSSGSCGKRLEVWVHPTDGSKMSTLVDNDCSEKEDYANMPFVELNKRFTLSFLHTHGMLFTKIGMEHFPEVSSSMLLEFEALLALSPCPFTETRLCDLLVVNMFNIERAASTAPAHDPASVGLRGMHSRGGPSRQTFRSLHQEHACRMGLDMFALLCQRCTQLVKNSKPTSVPLGEGIRLLLPAIRLWTDWMVVHREQWNPPPSQRDPTLGPQLDDWALVAGLCTQMAACLPDLGPVSYSTERVAPFNCSIVLMEEATVSGFTPMLDQMPQVIYYESSTDKAAVEDYIRLEKLLLFGDYLCGIEPQVFDYDVTSKRYMSVVPREQSEREDDHAHANLDVSLESQESVEDHAGAEVTEDAGLEGSTEDAAITELRQRRTALQLQEAEERRLAERMQSALDMAGGQRTTELEVVPLFLVLDTNCFIDCIKGIQAVVASKKYTVIVPLVVVNELEFLSRNDDGQENSYIIQKRASDAVTYLEEQFEKCNSNLKAMTSKGTLMDTIGFRHEEIDRNGRNNDDVILSCCLHFCSDKARDFMPRDRDQPIRLHRDVVLLTSDRNLRLKALNSHVPVRPLLTFLRWAKIQLPQ